MTLGRLVVRALAVGLLAGGSAGSVCNPVSIFACDADEDCIEEGGEGGVCEANSYCSFPAEDCPMGRRWHKRAASDLAGKCVEDQVAGTGGDDGSGGTGDSGTPDDADGTTSGGPGSTTGVTTVPVGDSTDGGTPATDGGTTVAMDGSTGTPAMTCDEQYGAVEGYMLCDEQPGSCSFNAVVNMAASCNDVCGMFGGTCLSADANDVDLCVSTAATTCDDMTFGDGICTCDRA